MIFTRINIIDGILTVKGYNTTGSPVDLNGRISCFLYRKENGSFVEVLRTDKAVLQLPQELSEEASVYVTLVVDNSVLEKHTKVKIVNTKVTTTYRIAYTTQSNIPLLSNALLDRFSYFMPKWSSAYQNDVSNFSKIFYPFFSNIEKLYFKVEESLDNAISETPVYRKKVKPAPRVEVGKVEGSSGEVRFSYNSTNSAPTRLTFLEINEPYLIVFREDSPITGIPEETSRLFISNTENTDVLIQGISQEGVFVSETFSFKNATTKVSKFKYETVLDIITESPTVKVSNYIDGSNDHIAEMFYETPLYSDRNKKIQFPTFNLKKDHLQMYTTEGDIGSAEGSSYILEKPLKSILVDKFGSIVGLGEDGYIYTGLLRKNLEVNMPLYSSNNLNKYVEVEDVDFEKKHVTFSINCKGLFETYGENLVKVLITSQEGSYYFDSITKSIVDYPAYLTLDKHNKLRLSFDINNSEFLSVVVSVGEVDLQASFRKDFITLTKMSDELYDNLFKTVDKIIVEKDGKYKAVTVHKDYYEVNESGEIILGQPASIYTLKGDLMNA